MGLCIISVTTWVGGIQIGGRRIGKIMGLLANSKTID